MEHISKCFGWFLDGVEAHFIDSDHPNASLIIDQVLVIREEGCNRDNMEVLAQLMEGGKK
jgi:hypothetical protein